MKTRTEFSRPLEVARVPAKGCHERIAATAEECEALAQRMSIAAIHSFAGLLQVIPWRGGGLKVIGQLDVDLDQVSVISLETFRSQQQFNVERYFLPNGKGTDDEADEIQGSAIDLGEIAAETMGLELDPYPRRADETFAGFDLDNEPVHNVSPFAELSKRPPSKK